MRSLFASAVIVLFGFSAASVAVAMPPCSSIASKNAIKHVFHLTHAYLAHLGNQPYFARGAESKLLGCEWVVTNKGYRQAAKEPNTLYVHLSVSEITVLPVSTDDEPFLEFRNLIEGSGNHGLYAVPPYGAEHSGGYESSDGGNKSFAVATAGWWSIALGRKLEIQIEWPHHRELLRTRTNQLAKYAVARDVLNRPF
jgi:hypothetical protein